MAAPIYKTKGELRSELLIALGYGGLGAAAGAFVPRADYLLEQAQENLYRHMPDQKRIRHWDLNTGINQQFYDFPLDCDPDRISELSVYFEQTWLKINPGIDLSHESTYEYINYYPQRYRIISEEYVIESIINGDFAIDDTSANGSAAAGWVWATANGWEVSTGKLRAKAAAGIVTSGTLPSGTYDVEYTIEDNTNLAGILIMGVANDVNGIALPITVGTHVRRVRGTTLTNGFWFNATGAGAIIDNISMVDVDNKSIKPQIQLWPTDSNRTYPWRIEGYIQLMPFVNDIDRATIDDRLILLHAEAFGKAHLNKPDAGVVMQELRDRLKLLRGEQHGEVRYIRGEEEKKILPWPQVID